MISNDPTLLDLLRSLWRARLYVLGGAVMGLVLAVLVMALAVPHYKATMLVGAAQPMGTQGADISNSSVRTGMAQPFVNDAPDFIRFENILRGHAVATILMTDKAILQGVAQDRCFSMQGRSSIETAAELTAYLAKKIRLEPVGQTSLRRLGYLHPDPEFATYFLRRIHRITDELIRRDGMVKNDRRMMWLDKALTQTIHPDHKKALTVLLMTLEQIRMLAAMDEEPFAAAVIEPPASTAQPYWPRKSVLFPVALFVGMFLGYALYGLRHAGHGHASSHPKRAG